MNQFTPAQVKAIHTWTEQRDALLREIGVFSTQSAEVQKKLKEDGLALEDIHNQIAEGRGRIAELAAVEERWRNSLPADIAELEVRKSRLEGEVVEKELKAKSAEDKYQIVTGATKDLSDAHVVMTDQAKIVEGVLGGIIQTSIAHASDAKVVMDEVRTIALEVIEKSRKNIETADIVIPKLTQFVVDLQRPIPVRRVPDRQVFRHVNPTDKEPQE